MTYRETLHELADATEAQVVAAYEQYEQGNLDEAAFVALVAAFVAAANNQAAALADLSLALSLTVALEAVVVPMGLTPPDGDAERLTRAAKTLVDRLPGTPDPRARVGRLGRAEPLRTAAGVYSKGIAASEVTTGWVRGRDADPCQLCTWWWREGRVWPKDHPMPTHPGCSCTPIPVTVRGRIKPVAV